MVEGSDDGLSELAFVATHGEDAARAGLDAVEHVRSCASCRATIDAITQAFDATLPPITPADAARSRLLSDVEGPARHAPFIGRVAAMFELDEAAAASLLTSVATSQRGWHPGPLEGTAWWPVRSPANARGAQTIFLRIEGGHRFPTHRHLGAETVLVLEGAFRSNDDPLAVAGDTLHLAPQSVHTLVVPAGGPCLCAVRVEEGIEVVFDDSTQPSAC